MSKKPSPTLSIKMRGLRRAGGNVLPLLLVTFGGVLLVLSIFTWRFSSMLGTHQEQTTATQAAALAAARAFSRIVINDPHFGFISLTDSAPKGRGVTASDGYGLPVRSFNELLATLRLDMIIADSIGDATMKQYAEADYQALMNSKDSLIQALQSAATGQTKMDRDGNIVDVVAEANEAYRSNVIRMGGKGATLVPGSLKISLGCIPGSRTNMEIPRPYNYASTPDDAQEQHFYRAYVNAPYAGRDFVFAAIHDSIILVDQAKFKATASLPYMVPSIVKAEADEQFPGGTTPGSPDAHQVHVIACAQCGTPPEPHNNSGALIISFPDGKLGEVAKVADLRTDPHLNTVQLGVRTTIPGDDYPQGKLGGSIIGFAPSASQMWSRIYYDWIKQAGANVNVKAVIDMQTDAIAPAFATNEMGFINTYTFYSSGEHRGWVKKRSLEAKPRIYGVLSDQQVVAVSTKAFEASSQGYPFDVSFTDNVFRHGTANGGKHGGEPIVDNRLNNSPVTASSENMPVINSLGRPRGKANDYTWGGKFGGYGYYFFRRHLLEPPLPTDTAPGGANAPQSGQPQTTALAQGDLRPTYVNQGVACEVAFHKVKFMTPCQIDQFLSTGF